MSSKDQSSANAQPSSSSFDPTDPTHPSLSNPLGLPAPPAPGTQTLDVSGDGSTVRLDALGPMVVNADGSLSRIANWDKMAEIEKQNTLRILTKRNRQRLQQLKERDEKLETREKGKAE